MISFFSKELSNHRGGRYTVAGQKYYFTRKQFTLEKRINLYKRILNKLNAGIDLITSLNEIHQVYASSKPDHHLVTIIGDMIVRLEKGQKFHTIIHRWGPPSEAMLLQAGELSGNSDSLKTDLNNVIQSAESCLFMKLSMTKKIPEAHQMWLERNAMTKRVLAFKKKCNGFIILKRLVTFLGRVND